MLKKIIQAIFKPQPITICVENTVKKKSCCMCNWKDNKINRHRGEKMLKIFLQAPTGKVTHYLCVKHARELRAYMMGLNLAPEEM